MKLIFRKSNFFTEFSHSAISDKYFVQITEQLILEIWFFNNYSQKFIIDLNSYGIEKIENIFLSEDILIIYAKKLHKLNLITYLCNESDFLEKISKEEKKKIENYFIENSIPYENIMISGTTCGHVIVSVDGKIIDVYSIRNSPVRILMDGSNIYAYGLIDHRIAKLNMNIMQYLHKKIKLNNDKKNNASHDNIIERQRIFFPVPINCARIIDGNIYMLHRDGSISSFSQDFKYNLYINESRSNFSGGDFTLNIHGIKIASNNGRTEIIANNGRAVYGKPIISYDGENIYFIDGYKISIKKISDSELRLENLLEEFSSEKNVERKNKSIKIGKYLCENIGRSIILRSGEKILRRDIFNKNYVLTDLEEENGNIIIYYRFMQNYHMKYSMGTEYRYKTK